MQRMRQPAFDGSARRHHRLSDHLPAEHPLPARFRAVAAKHVHLDRFEIEDRNQVNQAFGHRCAFVKLCVIPGREQNERPRNLEMITARFRVHAIASPGMTF